MRKPTKLEAFKLLVVAGLLVGILTGCAYGHFITCSLTTSVKEVVCLLVR